MKLRHQQQPGAGQQGPDGQRDPRADSLGDRPRRGGEGQQQQGKRQGGRARLKRAVAERHLQERDEQEDHAAERRVGDQREHVGTGELAGAEQLQRKHRVRGPPLNGDKGGRGGHADGRRGDHRRRQASGRLDQREAHPRNGEGGERGTAQIEAARARRVPGLRHVANRGHGDETPERKVDEEDRAPRHRVGQVPADGGADRARDRAQARPRADRPGAVIGMKHRLDDREAPRCKEGPANPLDEPGKDEQPDRRGGRAKRRRRDEDNHPQDEHAPSAVDVAERAAYQDERREREHIAVQGPLQPGDTRAEVTADGRQRHVDDRRLEQNHRVAQHRHRQHPTAGRRGKPDRAFPPTLVAWHQQPPWGSSLAPVCTPLHRDHEGRQCPGRAARGEPSRQAPGSASAVS